MTEKKEKIYTEMEKKFLSAMRDPGNKGRIKDCMRLAGYAESIPPSVLVKQLGEEMIQIAQEMMAAHSVQASLALTGVLVNAETLGAQHVIKAAESILDRAGVIKKGGEDVALKVPSGGLFILPAKKKAVDEESTDSTSAE